MSNLAISAATQTTGTLARSVRPVLSREAIQAEAEQRNIIREYINTQMVEGEDYGVIPGTEKKTLLKPGAEKLAALFRCSMQFTIEKEIEQFANPGVEGSPLPFFFYRFRCEVVSNDTGNVVSEGYGSCSSHETKYRYRNSDRVCPVCGKAAIIKSKYPPRDATNQPPGWYCFSKKGGCGVNFPAGVAEIEGQATGKVENPDVADVANTVLKMAKKRAAVDASLSLARCSDLFTQDAEDHDSPPATVHQNAPPAAPVVNAVESAKTRDDMLKYLEGAKSGDELRKLWGNVHGDKESGNAVITEEDYATVTEKKDELKAKFAATPQHQQQKAAPPQHTGTPRPNGATATLREAMMQTIRGNVNKLQTKFKEDVNGWLSRNGYVRWTLQDIADDQSWGVKELNDVNKKLEEYLKQDVPY